VLNGGNGKNAGWRGTDDVTYLSKQPNKKTSGRRRSFRFPLDLESLASSSSPPWIEYQRKRKSSLFSRSQEKGLSEKGVIQRDDATVVCFIHSPGCCVVVGFVVGFFPG
jgi:hypothetical protein